jgi:hypothetical protein
MYRNTAPLVADYRQIMERAMSGHDFTLFVTLNLNMMTTAEGALSKLRAFDARMNSKLLGTGWSRKPNEDRLKYFGALEHIHSNPHWHLLIESDNPMRVRALGNMVWTKLVPSGEFHAKLIADAPDPEEYRATLPHYMTKEFGNIEQLDSFVFPYQFSNQPMSRD